MNALAWAQQNPGPWLKRAFGVDMWPTQQRILESFRDNIWTYVPSCNGSGKTFTAAHAALWALYTHPDCKVITTATSWGTVERSVWGEIRNAWGKQLMPLGGPPPLTTHLELAPNWFMTGLSVANPVNAQGIHAKGGVWIICEEADGIPVEIWEALRGNMASTDCHVLAILNPIDPESYAAKEASNPKNNTIPIDAFSTPNFTAFGIVLEDMLRGTWRAKCEGKPLPCPWLITPEWVAEELEREGEESPFFVSRVKAQWPDVAEDALIKNAWIEKAWARWPDRDKLSKGPIALGHDVARYGDDKTVTAVRRGLVYQIMGVGSGLDSEGAAQQAMRIATTEWIAAGSASYTRPVIYSDVAGVGAGVFDILKKTERAVGVDNASQATDPTRYINRRAEMYWNFRELLRTENVALDPKDRQLAAELRSVRFKITGKNKVQIESKDDIKKRLKRSPDRADAVVLASAADSSVATSFLEAMKPRGK